MTRLRRRPSPRSRRYKLPLHNPKAKRDLADAVRVGAVRVDGVRVDVVRVDVVRVDVVRVDVVRVGHAVGVTMGIPTSRRMSFLRKCYASTALPRLSRAAVGLASVPP